MHSPIYDVDVGGLAGDADLRMIVSPFSQWRCSTEKSR